MISGYTRHKDGSTVARTKASGRIYGVTGGRANQPLVAIAANVHWFTPEDQDWRMATQAIYPVRSWFSASGYEALTDWIRTDLGSWSAGRKGPGSPVLVAADNGQNPDAAERMRDLDGGMVRALP